MDNLHDTSSLHACADPEGSRGPDPHPMENHKSIGTLSNTGPDPLKMHKATKPVFIGPLLVLF